MTRSLRDAASLALLLLLCFASGCPIDDPLGEELPPEPSGVELALEGDRPLLLVAADATEADPRDLDFLAAIAAATALTDGAPAVLAIDGGTLELPAVADYIDRYDPQLVVGIGIDPTEGNSAAEQVAVEGAGGAISLAATVWSRSPYAVVCDHEDMEAALLGSGLAARLRAPLLLWDGGNDDELDSLLVALQTEQVVVLGALDVDLTASTVPLVNAADVITWMDGAGLAIDYFAAVNPADRSGADGPKLSLLGPVFAARRDGFVALLPDSQNYEDVVDTLAAHRAALGRHPEYLALVGSTEAIPFAQVDNPLGWEDTPQLMTDAPYAQADEDPFLEMAVGRVIAEDLVLGSLLAARISTYEQLQDGQWERSLVDSGRWGSPELKPLLRNVGFEETVDGVGTHLSAFERLEVSFLLHSDHSNHELLGEAFDLSTETLLAPAVVVSAGCSVSGLDLDASMWHRSIVKHLLGQGAVAVLGAPRNAITQNSQLQTAFVNRLIEGHTLGQAFREGYASLTLNVLDNPDDSGSEHARHNVLLVGDPALTIFVPAAPVEALPALEGEDGSWETVAPGDPFFDPVPEILLEEWGWDEELYAVAVPGLDSHTYWGAGHDFQVLYYIAAVTADGPITSVTQEAGIPDDLGWTGGFHIDEHQDGTQTALWRTRFLELDLGSGEVVQQLERIAYSVE